MQLRVVVAFLVLLWISFVEIHLKRIRIQILSLVRLNRCNQTQDRCKLQSSSKRIKLKDGRYLAYRERGVPLDKSIYRIITVHGLHSTKEVDVLATQEVLEEMSIYMVQYDRAGYWESDQNIKRSVESEACDIEELADQLQIGSKFYIISNSAGSYPTWNCLRRIPHRLKGVAFIAPMINYKWNSLPRNLIKYDHTNKLARIIYWLCCHYPELLYSICTQQFNGVPLCTASLFTKKDKQVAGDENREQSYNMKLYPTQNDFEYSVLQDFMVAQGNWEFDPLELENPFPENESSVHIWHGNMDDVVPISLQRYVSKRLPWIHYHEIPDVSHDFWQVGPVSEPVLRSFLLGQQHPHPSLQVVIQD
ncbi:uncharacterized protein LOC107022911 [Solanum pennellii]|uniref:Uncharacterized protein LOC107022911 n=1 Tax=Solanum pennellii TaxID=28526 RepID=A0ABM1H1A5_SOLPN|nr:uncharacterized protein LOC107022911 [Solanum pennellii]